MPIRRTWHTRSGDGAHVYVTASEPPDGATDLQSGSIAVFSTSG